MARATATATATPTPPRRSSRSRRQVESIYEEQARESSLSPRKKKRNSSVGSGGRSKSPVAKSPATRKTNKTTKADESASEDEHDKEEEDDSSSSDNDEDFSKNKKSTPKKTAKDKRTTNNNNNNKTNNNKTKIQIGKKSPAAKRAGGGTTTRRVAMDPHQRSLNTSLATLAKNVLPPSEQSPSLHNLIAGLLYSFRPTTDSATGAGGMVDMGDNKSPYSSNLRNLAHKVISLHNSNPNQAQILLLNLMFRSVGGGPDTDLPLEDAGNDDDKDKDDDDDDDDYSNMEDEDNEETNTNKQNNNSSTTTKAIILEEMDTEEWARIITDLVDDMRHSPSHQILLCADPMGAVHQSHCLGGKDNSGGTGQDEHGQEDAIKVSAKDAQYSMGAQEFRKIYGEFWYTLGYLALTQGGMATTASSFEETESSNNNNNNNDNRSNGGGGGGNDVVRLDAELAKDLISRIIELAPVGQPDVRAAATLAALNMSHAVLDWSAQLVKKVDVAQRQYNAVKKNKGGGGGGRGGSGGSGGAKAEGLKVRIDSLKRSLSDLEEVVLGPVVQGLFVHRYRDSNEHIRTICIETLGRWCLQRPDIFLTDKYLKYFGWMMHDKHHLVRTASLTALLRPFVAVHNAADGKPRAVGEEHFMIDKIDLASLEHVVGKFLPRIADAVIDVKPEVQEVAMSLMLMLLKDGFLDEVNDDKLWNQVNLRALARDAPPNVRKDALYFILEQLEAFDEGDDEKEKEVSESIETSERKRAQQLDAIASYAAHAMTNGKVPIDKIQVDLADFLVQSLREMPEHKILVSDWNAMLRAIKDDNAAKTAHNVRAGERANVAKQRVLVRMLCHAAREEVGSVADQSFLLRDIDAETMAGSITKKQKSSGPGRKAPSMGREHESLSIALLKALPNLLLQFKGDLAIIPELASLPRFLIPTVFSLPQRKQEFMSLIKNLGEIYLSSSDERILTSTAQSLVSLSKGDHGRVAESKAQLKKLVTEIRDRIVDMMSTDDAASSAMSVDKTNSEFTSQRSSKRRSSRKKSTGDSVASSQTSLTDESSMRSAAADTEYSIFLNLKRLKILSQKIDLTPFFDNSANDVNQLELLCNFVCDGLKRRLQSCKPLELRPETEEEDETAHKVIDSPDMLHEIGKSVQEGLDLTLCVIAWSFASVQKSENLIMEDNDIIDNTEEEDDDDSSVEDHIVTRLRNRLLSLLELCFAQYLPGADDRDDDETSMGKRSFSSEQVAFADFVQLAAGKVTSDLRTLFPKEFTEAASPLLRSFALVDDGRLLGGNVRFVGSKEHYLLTNEGAEKENKTLPYSLLLPMTRAVTNNWTHGNRREAGMLLRHISSSGPTASEIINAAARVMKKVDSVRLLESQMASLRQSYENWVDDEPEVESERPTEEEMAEFEEAEKAHSNQFTALEQKSSNFSQTLGVFGRLGDKKLGPALNGFIREGIRFSFSNLDVNGEDTLVLGSRLSFLLLLSKYASWIKKNKQSKADIQKYIDELEVDMRNHEEFDDVHEDDLAALAAFRHNIGLKPLPKDATSVASHAEDGANEDMVDDESLDSVGDLATPTSTVSRSKGRRSSSSTMKSRGSLNRSSILPPLPEGEEETPPNSNEKSDDESHEEESEEGDEPTPSSKRSRSSRSQMSDSGSEDDGQDEEILDVVSRRKKIRSN